MRSRWPILLLSCVLTSPLVSSVCGAVSGVVGHARDGVGRSVCAIVDDAAGFIQHYRYQDDFGRLTSHAGTSATAVDADSLPLRTPYTWRGLSQERLPNAAKTLFEAGMRTYDVWSSSYLERPPGAPASGDWGSPTAELDDIEGRFSYSPRFIDELIEKGAKTGGGPEYPSNRYIEHVGPEPEKPGGVGGKGGRFGPTDRYGRPLDGGNPGGSTGGGHDSSGGPDNPEPGGGSSRGGTPGGGTGGGANGGNRGGEGSGYYRLTEDERKALEDFAENLRNEAIETFLAKPDIGDQAYFTKIYVAEQADGSFDVWAAVFYFKNLTQREQERAETARAVLDAVHTGLEVLSIFPGPIGTTAGVVAAGISLVKGDISSVKDAIGVALPAFAALGAVKFATRAGKAADAAVDAARGGSEAPQPAH